MEITNCMTIGCSSCQKQINLAYERIPIVCSHCENSKIKSEREACISILQKYINEHNENFLEMIIKEIRGKESSYDALYL